MRVSSEVGKQLAQNRAGAIASVLSLARAYQATLITLPILARANLKARKLPILPTKTLVTATANLKMQRRQQAVDGDWATTPV